MKYTKNLILLGFLTVTLSGCGHTWFTNFFGSNHDDTDFVLDNDSVFDLFEDGDTPVGELDSLDLDLNDDDDNSAAANDPGPPVSTTVDPEYDRVGKMTPDELSALGILEIPVLLLGGNEFPFPAKQFRLAGIDQCDHAHYHGASGFSIDLEDIPEPSNPCGFDNNVTQRTVTGHQMIDWFHNRPRNF